MRTTWIAAGAALVLLGGLGAPAAAARDQWVPFGSPAYLAIGDSVAAGVGAEPGAAGYPERLVALLEDGYDPLIDRAHLHASMDFELVNLAAGGVTTDTLIDTQLPAARQMVAERRSNLDPFDDVEVATLTVGGNDVFDPAVQACVLDESPTGCQSVVAEALPAVQEGLTEILRPLVEAAGPGAEVVVTTYYNPIGSCDLSRRNPASVSIADAVLEGGTVPGVLTVQAGLNDRIREVAAATGAQVAELYGALDAGQYVGGADCRHPNAAGHARIAEVVYATVAR